MLADWRNYSDSLLNDSIQTVALYSTANTNEELINSSLKSGNQTALYITVDDKLVWPEPNIAYYTVDSNFKSYDLKSLTIGQKIEASCLNVPLANGHSHHLFYYNNNKKEYLNQDSDFLTVIPPDAYNKTLYCEYSISDTSKDNAVVTICTVDDLINFTIQQANLKIGNEDISYTPPTFDNTTYQVKEQGKYIFNFKNWNIQYGSDSYNNDGISFWYPLSTVCDLIAKYGDTTLATGTTESNSLTYELNNSNYNLWANDQFTAYVTIVPKDIKWAKEAEITCKDTYGLVGYVDFKGYPALSILGRTGDSYYFPKVFDDAKTITANYYSDIEKSTLLGSNTLSMTNNITSWQSGNTTYFSGNTESNLWDLTYSPINSYTLSGTSLDITNKIPDNYKVTITFLESDNVKISKSGLDNPKDILYWSTTSNAEASYGDIITVGINNTAFAGCLNSTTTLDTFNFMLLINEDSTTKKYTLTTPELSEKHDTININYYINSNILATHSYSGNYGFAGWRETYGTTTYAANKAQVFSQDVTLYPYYNSVNNTISDTTPTYSKNGSWGFYNDTALIKTINTGISVSEWYDGDNYSYSANTSAIIPYTMVEGFRTDTNEHSATIDLYAIYSTDNKITIPDAWCIIDKYIQTGWDVNKTVKTATYACGATVTINSLSNLNKTLYAIEARNLITFTFRVVDPYKIIYSETPHTLAIFTERKEDGQFTIPSLPETTKTKELTLNYNNTNQTTTLSYGITDTAWKTHNSAYDSLTPKKLCDYPIGSGRGISDADTDVVWYVECGDIKTCTLPTVSSSDSDYYCLGWSSNSAASTAMYSIGDIITYTTAKNNNISTLYAIWSEKKTDSVKEVYTSATDVPGTVKVRVVMSSGRTYTGQYALLRNWNNIKNNNMTISVSFDANDEYKSYTGTVTAASYYSDTAHVKVCTTKTTTDTCECGVIKLAGDSAPSYVIIHSSQSPICSTTNKYNRFGVQKKGATATDTSFAAYRRYYINTSSSAWTTMYYSSKDTGAWTSQGKSTAAWYFGDGSQGTNIILTYNANYTFGYNGTSVETLYQ